MCKTQPGPRCSDHSHTKLDHVETRLGAAQQVLAEAEAALAAAEDAGRATTRLTQRRNTAQRKADALVAEQELAQLAFDATPLGQQGIEKLLRRGRRLTPEDRANLEYRLSTARVYREWQSRINRRLQTIEAERGPEAAAAYAARENAKYKQRLTQVGEEMLAKHRAAMTKAGTPLTPGQKVDRFIALYGKVYFRLNRYRNLLLAITGDLDKFAGRRGVIEQAIATTGHGLIDLALPAHKGPLVPKSA